MKPKTPGMKPGIYGADSAEAQAIIQMLRGAYAKVEAEKGRVETRPDDGRLATIAWNAVVLGHPNRFEDMRETAVFVKRMTQTLTKAGHLKTAALPYAEPMLMAFLRFVWSTQNVMHLDPQFARGQAGAVEVLIQDIQANWTPPDEQPWFKLVRRFPEAVDQGLAKIDEQGWEGVYTVLKPTMNAIAEKAVQALAEIEKQHAAVLPGAAAYVSGVLVDRNKFSPLDGSVPESIGEALTQRVGNDCLIGACFSATRLTLRNERHGSVDVRSTDVLIRHSQLLPDGGSTGRGELSADDLAGAREVPLHERPNGVRGVERFVDALVGYAVEKRAYARRERAAGHEDPTSRDAGDSRARSGCQRQQPIQVVAEGSIDVGDPVVTTMRGPIRVATAPLRGAGREGNLDQAFSVGS